MEKIKSFIVITRYNEDFSWVENYTDRYLIYNKGEPIFENNHVVNVENRGMNAITIPYFSYTMYNSKNIPELIAFLQAYPYDHCSKNIFDKLIYNDKFTTIDDPYILGESPSYRVNDGFFEEFNSRGPIGNWFPTPIIQRFDDLMYKYFEDYDSPDWVRFGKGIQYIVEREQLLSYPRKFWKSLMDDLPYLNMAEGHFIERAMWYILTNQYKLKEEYYD